MGTINGLPAHILLVHAVVVLLPLAALLLVLTAIWPPVRRRLAGPNAILSLLVVALVPVTTSAGEWLEHRVTESALLHDHTELGETAILAALPVALLAVAIWWRQREADGTTRRTYLAAGSATITKVVVALAVVIAGFAIYDTYRIGESGAKASWTGDFSSTPSQEGPGQSDGD